MAGSGSYKVLGFLFLSGRLHFTDPAVYGDWFGMSFGRVEMRETLYFGKLPEGLIFSGPDGVVVVQGRWGEYKQKLVAIGEVLGTNTPPAVGALRNGDYVRRYWPTSHDVGTSLRRLDALQLEIARHMLALRGVLNMTQLEMADYLGLSGMTIIRIEHGYETLKKKTMGKLMKLAPVYEEMMNG